MDQVTGLFNRQHFMSDLDQAVAAAAEGKQDKEIAAQLGVSAQKAARWRARFLQHGVRGLDQDAPRPGRTATRSATPGGRKKCRKRAPQRGLTAAAS